MKTEIQVPAIGESITSGILAAWLKSDGEAVTDGEELFELETDKATLAVPSPAAGALKITIAEGEEVEVGQVVGTIDGSATAAAAPATATPESEPAGSTLSPAVRRIVAEHRLDPAGIAGSGPGGRITKGDALKAAEAQNAAKDQDAAGEKPAVAAKASPAAKAETTASAPSAGSAKQRRVPMSNLRKRIAENLVASKQNSAHVTTFNELDMSTVMGIRAKHKDAFLARYGVKLGFMSFFVKASQYALEQSPEVNAFLDGTDIVYNDSINIGVALSSEKGLLTPVIKDVARQGFGDVETLIVDFIARANKKRLMPDEMVGATFTISNGGVFGSLLSTPIPSPPQTAVLGMHTIEKRPVVINDEIVIRPMMYVALTYDHRMIDGREAVGFLGKIKQFVEDPTELLLGL